MITDDQQLTPEEKEKWVKMIERAERFSQKIETIRAVDRLLPAEFCMAVIVMNKSCQVAFPKQYNELIKMFQDNYDS